MNMALYLAKDGVKFGTYSEGKDEVYGTFPYGDIDGKWALVYLSYSAK